MKTSFSRPARACFLALVALLGATSSGCGRSDTRVNSDPGPGKPSQADSGDKALRPEPNQTAPRASGTGSTTGTDSTGRPSDASGGTTKKSTEPPK